MKMTGAEMVLACLEAEHVDVVFGFPGGAVLTLYDEIYKKGVRHILSRHEQGAIHAADGYARATGKPGIVIATSGPGATNLVTGIATAYMDSVPLIVITGQVARPFIGTDAFQEADITGITLPITKHNYLITKIEELPIVFKEAFIIARTGRPGPVLIDLPKDIQAETSDFEYPHKVEIHGYRPTCEGHQGQISKALALIRKAQKPVIYAGGGVAISGAHAELLEFSRKAAIPVTTTLTGMGTIPYDYDLFLGMPGMHGTYAANHAIYGSDLLITIGARFDDRVTGKIDQFVPHARIIHMDIDPAEIGKNIAADIPIVGDVRMVLKEILKNLRPGETQEWRRSIKEWKAAYPLRYKKSDAGNIKPQFVIEELDRISGGDAIVATDVGQHQMWTAQYFGFKEPRRLLSSGGLGTMGYGFPAAIGAQVAFPESLVICISGDGSFQMNSQELATAAYYNIPVKIALINNHYLGMVRQWQKMFYEGRYSQTSMDGSPDFVRLAEAYGAKGYRAETPGEVGSVIEKAFQTPGPVLMDFHVEQEEDVLPMVAPNTSIIDMVIGSEE